MHREYSKVAQPYPWPHWLVKRTRFEFLPNRGFSPCSATMSVIGRAAYFLRSAETSIKWVYSFLRAAVKTEDVYPLTGLETSSLKSGVSRATLSPKFPEAGPSLSPPVSRGLSRSVTPWQHGPNLCPCRPPSLLAPSALHLRVSSSDRPPSSLNGVLLTGVLKSVSACSGPASWPHADSGQRQRQLYLELIPSQG